MQFDVMREIALSSASGANPPETADIALRKTARLVGLSAGALVLWDDQFNPILNVTYAEEDKDKQLLNELEKDLFSNLRKEKHLVSAYVSFGGDEPVSSFTLPIKKGEQILGAVMGVQPGKGSMVREDVFLEALAAALSISVLLGQMDSIVEEAKLDVVLATAATVNDRINNPLQAILGIVQLLPKSRKDLDDELMAKLRLIEESVHTIMKITHKLMNVSEVEFTDYVEGTKMLKLPEDEESS